jgi:hypothetical protein
MVLDSYTDSRVTILESKSGLTEFVQSASNSQKPAVVLLSQKSEVASLYKALSTQLRGRMAFAQVRSGVTTGCWSDVGERAMAARPTLAASAFMLDGIGVVTGVRVNRY